MMTKQIMAAKVFIKPSEVSRTQVYTDVIPSASSCKDLLPVATLTIALSLSLYLYGNCFRAKAEPAERYKAINGWNGEIEI